MKKTVTKTTKARAAGAGKLDRVFQLFARYIGAKRKEAAIRREIDAYRPAFLAICKLYGDDQIKQGDALVYVTRRAVYDYGEKVRVLTDMLATEKAYWESTHAPAEVVESWSVRFEGAQS